MRSPENLTLSQAQEDFLNDFQYLSLKEVQGKVRERIEQHKRYRLVQSGH